MQDYERLGVFYLGRHLDPETSVPTDDLYLYDAKHLTTHAMCVGMTGSGKTGLCLSLLEEAAIDGIPVLAVDPKGDLGNLLLTFPELAPADFAPWIDESEAARKGLSIAQYAEQTANTWKNGLAASGQSGERIARLKAAADFSIYTPGSTSGLPLSILRSFRAPPPETLEDGDSLRERIESAVTGLLGLLDLEADPLTSREHILLSTILDRAWREGRDLELGDLIREIQKPPFTRVGVFDLESFFPGKERGALAMRINNLLASPAFAAWTAGEPLDIQRLLFTPQGKPRVSILSIAHLADSQRMFFVTLLLNELIAWMRAQSGTSSLRAILYMDEVFGYLPPIANPPSKKPMLTLLKQARAFGLGCAFATQNPVDLDYKALSNIGTWFLGRLQTERDKARVLDGLEGAAASSGRAFERAHIDRLLSGLKNRVFLVNDVHEDAPALIQSRFALSYLRGPLTRTQIQMLMSARASHPTPNPPKAVRVAPAAHSPAASRPLIANEFAERFVRTEGAGSPAVHYRPFLLGSAKVRFVSASDDVDAWNTATVLTPLSTDLAADPWSQSAAEFPAGPLSDLEARPPENASFAALPGELANARSHAELVRSLRDWLAQHHTVTLFRAKGLGVASRAGEKEGDFRARLVFAARERRDLEIGKLRDKYASKLRTLQDRIRRAEQAVSRQAAQSKSQTLSSAASIGASILGALFGRRSVTTSRAVSAARSIGRAAEQQQDVKRAEENVTALREEHVTLEREIEAAVSEITNRYTPDAIELETVNLRPKKSDLIDLSVTLVWMP